MEIFHEFSQNHGEVVNLGQNALYLNLLASNGIIPVYFWQIQDFKKQSRQIMINPGKSSKTEENLGLPAENFGKKLELILVLPGRVPGILNLLVGILDFLDNLL